MFRGSKKDAKRPYSSFDSYCICFDKHCVENIHKRLKIHSEGNNVVLDLQVVITEYILGSRASRMPASLPPWKPKDQRSRFSPREGPLRIIEGIFQTTHMHLPDNPDAFLSPGIMKEVVSVV